MQKVKGGEEERDRSDTTSGCGTGQSSEEGVSNLFLTYSIIKKAELALYTSFSIFPSPAGMSLTKLSLGGNNDVMYKLFLPRESLASDIPAADGNIEKLFLRCTAIYLVFRVKKHVNCLCNVGVATFVITNPTKISLLETIDQRVLNDL